MFLEYKWQFAQNLLCCNLYSRSHYVSVLFEGNDSSSLASLSCCCSWCMHMAHLQWLLDLLQWQNHVIASSWLYDILLADVIRMLIFPLYNPFSMFVSSSATLLACNTDLAVGINIWSLLAATSSACIYYQSCRMLCHVFTVHYISSGFTLRILYVNLNFTLDCLLYVGVLSSMHCYHFEVGLS